MAPIASLPLTSSEAREAAAGLDAIVEARIDLALTPAVLTQLALKGITEDAARIHLRKSAAKALLAEYGK